MYSDRDSIKEDIRKRLVKIKGIGPEKAAKGSDAVMEYLDGLVQNRAGSSPKPGERDEDGIEVMKRPEDIQKKFNYMYWDVRDGQTWVNTEKPQGIPDNSIDDHWSAGMVGIERCVSNANYYYLDYWKVKPINAIRRLVD